MRSSVHQNMWRRYYKHKRLSIRDTLQVFIHRWQLSESLMLSCLEAFLLLLMDGVYTAQSTFAYLPYGVLVQRKELTWDCVSSLSYMKESHTWPITTTLFNDWLSTQASTKFAVWLHRWWANSFYPDKNRKDVRRDTNVPHNKCRKMY